MPMQEQNLRQGGVTALPWEVIAMYVVRIYLYHSTSDAGRRWAYCALSKSQRLCFCYCYCYLCSLVMSESFRPRTPTCTWFVSVLLIISLTYLAVTKG